MTNNFNEILIDEASRKETKVKRSFSTVEKIQKHEGSINSINKDCKNDTDSASASDDIKSRASSFCVVGLDFTLEKEDFLKQYHIKMNIVEEFFKSKINELFNEYDKLKKKMSEKKTQSVYYIVISR
jgi:hypothetical protein